MASKLLRTVITRCRRTDGGGRSEPVAITVDRVSD